MRAHLVVLSLTAATLVATSPSAPASAAPPTCFGKRATIVGSSADRSLTGTPRADVIVTRGARSVDSGGGDDLVCITGRIAGRPRAVIVLAGRGDDRIRVEGRQGSAEVDLGPGDDLFVGGSGADQVRSSGSRRDRDVIRTRAGEDRVGVRAGAGGIRDVISLGPQADTLIVAGLRAAGLHRRGSVDVGTGRDVLEVQDADTSEPVSIDLGRGSLRVGDATPLRWRGAVTQVTDHTRRAVDVRGTSRAETVDVVLAGEIRLAGGDDRLDVYNDFDHAVDAEPANGGAVAGSVLAGGAGHDAVRLGRYDTTLQVDLALGSATDAEGGSREVSGFEELDVAAKQLSVRGTEAADELVLSGCTVEVLGLAGDDVIRAGAPQYTARDDHWWIPCAYDVTVDGGAGDDDVVSYAGADHLSGGEGDDRLDGGDGTDSADGGAGTDTCVAEARTDCEG